MSANAPSFKQMIKDGTAKRADAMKFRIEDIHEEPGFNLREEGEDLEASIDALAEYIAQGGIVPPLEVRPRIGGGVFLVDGHRRRRAYLKVADQLRDGSGELYINVVPFSGNDADRVARIITSAEGRALSQLEVAKGYKRLAAFNWSPQEIAAKVGKTRQHVDQLLILASANSDVQALVKEGTVSATTAIDAVRKHGEGAGEVLATEVGKAQAAGKRKATAATIKGKPIPRKLSDEAFDTLAGFHGVLTTADHETLATLNLAGDIPRIGVPADVVLELVEIHRAATEFRAEQERKAHAATAAEAQGELA
jgi:ParB-like chromosome segregation protein Spo0J